MAVRVDTPAPQPPASAPERRSRGGLVVVIVLVFALGLGTGYNLWHHSFPREYVYTGTVAAICGGAQVASLTRSPNCFALTPDKGTAHDDGYYSGAGQVSFGVVPTDNGSLANLKVGAHVQVTVVSVPNAGSGVVLVTAAP